MDFHHHLWFGKVTLVFLAMLMIMHVEPMPMIMHGDMQLRILESHDPKNPNESTSSLEISTDEGVIIDTARVVFNRPQHEELFFIQLAHSTKFIKLKVNKGFLQFSADEIASGKQISGCFDLMSGKGRNPLKCKMRLSLEIKFSPASDRHASDQWRVPGTSFPQREGCRIIPYQDAHCNKMHGACWEDIYDAMQSAQEKIWITGWALNTNIKLIPDDKYNYTLGELLKKKAEEGVDVRLVLWDDKAGFMGTHCKETKKYFEGSSVSCILSSRTGSSEDTILYQQVTKFVYTHHHKSVIVDADGDQDSTRRSTIAFIGGLDLTDGRYDTPEHRLLPDRPDHLPWHDLHVKVEGEAAYDIEVNFKQIHEKITSSKGKLSPFNDHPISPTTKHANSSPKWNVQIFRTIDSGSITYLPHQTLEKNVIYREKSIQIAYVEAIRSAKKFIYIENQYFIGSSYAWLSHKGTGADNLIPMELTLKIISKIEANERFAVYVLIPMWPEGKPNGYVEQQILFWQGETMRMMYKRIAEAIEKAGVNSHPQDYLNFYCLGKRQQIPTAAEQVSQKKYKRNMIYVHSKGMVVDDEYMIIGSANINQRSMDGSIDTEIAMGAYQPHHTRATAKGEQHPQGGVFAFRKSLWNEHLGSNEAWYDEPEKLECVNKVKEISEENWRRYSSDDGSIEMQGHLLKYPVQVDSHGNVNSLPGHECFPDVGGKVLGTNYPWLPKVLTT